MPVQNHGVGLVVLLLWRGLPPPDLDHAFLHCLGGPSMVFFRLLEDAQHGILIIPVLKLVADCTTSVHLVCQMISTCGLTSCDGHAGRKHAGRGPLVAETNPTYMSHQLLDSLIYPTLWLIVRTSEDRLHCHASASTNCRLSLHFFLQLAYPGLLGIRRDKE